MGSRDRSLRCGSGRGRLAEARSSAGGPAAAAAEAGRHGHGSTRRASGFKSRPERQVEPMIVYCAADLLWATRIKATADSLAIPCRPARSVDMLKARLADSDVRAVIVDLDAPE